MGRTLRSLEMYNLPNFDTFYGDNHDLAKLGEKVNAELKRNGW